MIHLPGRRRKEQHSQRRLIELDALLHQTLKELRVTLDRIKEADRDAGPNPRPDAG
jgi:hypothetical protein